MTAVRIAEAAVALDFGQAFWRGVLCDVLVCLAAWLCFAAHDVTGKILAIILPISAFVALGFEHSVANIYLIPIAMLAGADQVTLASCIGNLVPVTLGNIVGGGGLVAAVYWLIYLHAGGQPERGLRGQALESGGMIQVMPNLPDHVLGLSAEGEVTGEDYEQTFIPAVEERIRRHGKVRVLYHLGPAFTGYTVAAMWDDAKLGLTHRRDFEKVAVVTDVDWCRYAVRLFAPLIPCPVKLFANADLAGAEDWVKS